MASLSRSKAGPSGVVKPATAPDEPAVAPAGRPYSLQAIHLLRTVQNNTLKLSQMADQKASILMGAVLVVLTLAQLRLARRSER